MPTLLPLEWRIIAAAIDREDAAASDDSDLVHRISTALELARDGARSAEVAGALGPMMFEWSWSNCDGDPSELFEEPTDFSLAIDESNSEIEAGMVLGELVLSVRVLFTVQVIDGYSAEDVHDWLQENSAAICGFVGGGWSYSGDEGQSVEVARG